MLVSEQVAELLTRCECACGLRLEQLRGNLLQTASRPAAIWELLVLEAVASLGDIEYEPDAGSQPDAAVVLRDGSRVYVEAAYVRRRFLEEEVRSDAVWRWLVEEARRRGIQPTRIGCQFDGTLTTGAGPVREVPQLHERKQFLRLPEIVEFFDAVVQNPSQDLARKLTDYNVEVSYHTSQGPDAYGYGGLVQDAPSKIEEHSVFRALHAKARQHRLDGPLVVALGSDENSMLSDFGGPQQVSLRDAINSGFRRHSSISAVWTVSIENRIEIFTGLVKEARTGFYRNADARWPLNRDAFEQFSGVDFNRWKYSTPLRTWPNSVEPNVDPMSGPLEVQRGGGGLEVSIPASVLIDGLAGRRSLIDTFGLENKEPVCVALHEQWTIVHCSCFDEDIEQGVDYGVVLSLERWRYAASVEPNVDRMSEPAIIGRGGASLELLVPGRVLIDALAGRRSLVDVTKLGGRGLLWVALQEQWTIIDCSLAGEAVERGVGQDLILRLQPRREDVFN